MLSWSLSGIDQVDRWERLLFTQGRSIRIEASVIVQDFAETVKQRAAVHIRNAAPPKRVRRDRPRRTDYVASFRTVVDNYGISTVAEVGTDLVYGWRLEAGFVGADSLGRHYNQAPRPHWGPAADEVAPWFEHAIAEAAVDFAQRP